MAYWPLLKNKVKSTPDFVIDNLDSIRTLRKHCHISLGEIHKATLIPITRILDWELGNAIPSKVDYNKLAAFFDWEIWN